jgi:hypothetical protein
VYGRTVSSVPGANRRLTSTVLLPPRGDNKLAAASLAPLAASHVWEEQDAGRRTSPSPPHHFQCVAEALPLESGVLALGLFKSNFEAPFQAPRSGDPAQMACRQGTRSVTQHISMLSAAHVAARRCHLLPQSSIPERVRTER